MKRLLLTICFLLIFAASCFATEYFIATNGTAGGAGTIGDPWDLQTGLNKLTECAVGNNFNLRGGTYSGKFSSTLDGCVVRSYCVTLTGGCLENPTEWAKIDGDATTTLNGAINSSVTSITVVSTAGLLSGETIVIDSETMQIDTVNSSTVLTVNRGWSPTIGGAAAHSDAATVRQSGNTLAITGTGTTYRDFEVKNSYTQRDLEPSAPFDGQGCCGFYSGVRGAGIGVSGSNNNFINLIIHDHLDGIFTGSTTSNTLIYGVLTYNNGGHYFDSGGGREQGSGMGMYLENASGYSRVYRNISLNNFNYSAQFQAVTGVYLNGDHQKNVFANGGSPMGGLITPTIRNFNVFYNPGQAGATASLTDNVYFQPYNSTGGDALHLNDIATLTLTGNYIIGGPITLSVNTIGATTTTGNTIYGGAAPDYIQLTGTNPTGTWDNNTYPDGQGRAVYDGLSFANWKSGTGYDASSTETLDPMADTVIAPIPNEYEAGRCHFVVIAPSAPTSINVNFTTCGLANGQAYTIKNAFNWFGSDVATGTYNSGSPTVSVPLNGAAATVATPTGMAFTPATTCPDLCVFTVIPGAQSSTIPRITTKGGIWIRNILL